MMTPLETRVAFNAVPNQGPIASQEQTGTMFRQLQELKEAGIQTKTRDTRVDELKEKEQSAFRPIENPGDDSPRKQELFDRERERQQSEKGEIHEVYAPVSSANVNKNRGIERIGQFLDLTG